MVDVVVVTEDAKRITKIGTSGFESNPDMVANANEVNLDLMAILSPHYGKVKAVTDILNTFVVDVPCEFISGLMGIPEDFYGYISIYKQTGENTAAAYSTVRQIKTNQVGAIGQNTIRRGTVTAPNVRLEAGNFVLTPINGDTGLNLIYFRLPADVDIVVTPVEGETDDYEAVTDQTNYEWPARCANLLIYLLVNRLGGEMKQEILVELAGLGIQMNLTVEPVS